MKFYKDKIIILFFPIVVAVVCSSCRDHVWRVSSNVKSALKIAGANRADLEEVLTHFEEEGDSEKIAASKFLISNMPWHTSMTGEYEAYYDSVDVLLDRGLKDDALKEKMQKISDNLDIRYEPDVKILSAEYLIKNIDQAFKEWREGEWARHLSFEEFCEILLPYTCSQSQPVMEWRDSLYRFAFGILNHLKECYDYEFAPRAAVVRVNDALKGMIKSQLWLHDINTPTVYRPATFIKLPGARCDEYAENATLIMRSKGIPIAIDFTPQWPDRLYGHTWCVMRSVRGKYTMFNPFATNPDYPHYINSRISKVFRRTYSTNLEYLSVLRGVGEESYKIVDNPFFKDVSEEYFYTSNLEVDLFPYAKRKSHAYIAVFDNFNWKQVYWGRIKGRKALFERMGRRILYMAMVVEDGNLIPASLPFLVDDFGKITYIEQGDGYEDPFIIERKSPMFQNVFVVQKYLQGGSIYASDYPDDGFVKIADIPDWPLTSGSVELDSKPYRFWKFAADEGRETDMAELYFYHKDSTFPHCTVSAAGKKDDDGNKIIDNDPLTFFHAEGKDKFVVIDLGEKVPVSHVSYIKRGDGNAVTPRDSYEVSHWNGRTWIRDTSVLATDVRFQLRKMPKGALYYIRDVTRGQQNRVFLWDGKRKKVEWH